MSEKLRVAARLLLGRRNSVVRESSGAGRPFTPKDTMSRPKKKKDKTIKQYQELWLGKPCTLSH